MEDIIFELKDVHFSYLNKFPALCGIDMFVRKGEMISVIGANGSGKSTLLQILDGLIFAQKGSVRALGRELNEDAFSDEEFSRIFRKKIGFVFQNPDVQLFCPSVKEDITFGPLQLGMARNEVNARFDKLVELLKIKDLIERSPHQLSIGEKRKVAIATTLIIEPEVLILDEPTAGLDPITTRQIIDLLIEENDRGKTIITTTHDLHIVEEISDTVYVFSLEKKIAGFGLPEKILNNPDFLKKHNLLHIHSHRHKEKVHTHPHEHLEHHT